MGRGGIDIRDDGDDVRFVFRPLSTLSPTWGIGLGRPIDTFGSTHLVSGFDSPCERGSKNISLILLRNSTELSHRATTGIECGSHELREQPATRFSCLPIEPDKPAENVPNIMTAQSGCSTQRGLSSTALAHCSGVPCRQRIDTGTEKIAAIIFASPGLKASMYRRTAAIGSLVLISCAPLSSLLTSDAVHRESVVGRSCARQHQQACLFAMPMGLRSN